MAGYAVAPLPDDEAARLRAVKALGLLDTPPEERFDAVVRLAARFFKVPISYVALIDKERQWFKSKFGLVDTQTPREVAFCSFTILSDKPFVVQDAANDERFANNPLVTGDPHIGSYCGVPLTDVNNHKVGTLCLADHEAHDFTQHDTEVLESDAYGDRAGIAISGTVEPRYFHDVSVLFTDFVGFTSQTEKLAAEDLVTLLNGYFSAFDSVAGDFGMEKLKTIGDSYMCVGGLPAENASHPVDAILAALQMRAVMREFNKSSDDIKMQVRIGIHTGPVVAGVIGMRRFAFDIWGETVNFSSRMESAGAPDCINISDRTYSRVKDFFECEPRGKVLTKEKKEYDMYFVKGILPSPKFFGVFWGSDW